MLVAWYGGYSLGNLVVWDFLLSGRGPSRAGGSFRDTDSTCTPPGAQRAPTP